MKKTFLIILLFLSVFIYANEDILKTYIKNFDSLKNKDFSKILDVLDIKKIPTYKIIHGSVLVRKSQFEWFIPLKYYYIYVGMLEMKEVVRNDFDNLVYRYIRGKTAYEIKDYDFAEQIFIEDFEYIYIRANEEFKRNYDFGEILYKLYNVYKEKDKKKADKYFNELKYINSKYYGMIENEK
ncbi:MAG: hypothetical protein B6I29_01690 [Marinitoga sp. 4572_148]|nr:MAG: hypothetical protein B6I29_01690 [Marinitoga sp. 4572_148]